MGFDSTSVLPADQGVDNNGAEISLVLNNDSPVVEECVDEQVLAQAPLKDKEDVVEPFGEVCYLENNKGVIAEAISPLELDRLELSISIEVADEGPSSNCQTPRESIFDPFAPGPEEAACCAPKKKVIRVPSRRQLNFESGDYPVKRLSYELDDSEEECQFLEGIRKMFIDLIISNQALGATRKDLVDASSPGSCKTPVSEPLLTGIADTCPDAPMRRSLKAVKLSPTICRKLNFDSVSPRSLFVQEDE